MTEIRLQGSKVRITNPGLKTFIDIKEPDEYQGYALEMNIFSNMHYTVIAKIYGDCMSIMVFPDVETFNDWYKNIAEDEKPEILCCLSDIPYE